MFTGIVLGLVIGSILGVITMCIMIAGDVDDDDERVI